LWLVLPACAGPSGSGPGGGDDGDDRPRHPGTPALVGEDARSDFPAQTDTAALRSAGVLALAASGYGNCALLGNGTVKCWGENADGQLGVGDTVNRGGSPEDMGDDLPAVKLGSACPVRAIATGFAHACALCRGGGVKCWGRNVHGQLGLNNVQSRGGEKGQMGDHLPFVNLGTRERAIAIAAGSDHTCALLQDGGVKCWGFNHSGQLGLGHTITWGNAPGEMGDNLPRVDLGDGARAIAITAGGAHTCALLQDHTVKCWGDNHHGELGLGDREARGDGPHEMGNALQRVNLGFGAKVLRVAAGWEHTCALLFDGQVKCWGHNDSGQLGLGDLKDRGAHPMEMGNQLPSVDLGGIPALELGAGVGHTCALLVRGDVKCWGNNDIGQLGLGDAKDRGFAPDQMGTVLPFVDLGTEEYAISLALGAMHTCAMAGRRIKCWGDNYAGQLGLGDHHNRGDEPGEMGDSLPDVQLLGPH
jgi:alpha-tubulin suppressor-like RCC1 family protein